MTNLGNTEQDGHRSGIRTKVLTNNGDSEAVTNQAVTNHGDTHQDDRRQAPDGDQEAGKGAGAGEMRCYDRRQYSKCLYLSLSPETVLI